MNTPKKKEMSENYIKSLLEKRFKNVGNFRQREFNAYGGSSRPDFVLLGDDYFNYYEIKTDKDNFSRLPSQITNAIGLFTHMFIVAPSEKMIKMPGFWSMDIGMISVEELEENRSWHFRTQSYAWELSIQKVKKLLWANDLRNLIMDRCQGYKGTRKTVSELEEDFIKFYTNEDCFYILNKILPTRTYDLREHNGSKNL